MRPSYGTPMSAASHRGTAVAPWATPSATAITLEEGQFPGAIGHPTTITLAAASDRIEAFARASAPMRTRLAWPSKLPRCRRESGQPERVRDPQRRRRLHGSDDVVGHHPEPTPELLGAPHRRRLPDVEQAERGEGRGVGPG